MRTLTRTLVFLISLFFVIPSWSADVDSRIGQLGSPDESSRRAAYQALVQQGPEILGQLFESMDPSQKTLNLSARNTAERIVHNAGSPGAEPQRVQAESALLQVIQSSCCRQNKEFALRLLSRIGTERSVPVLADVLNDKIHRETARCTLVLIPSRKATASLVKALKGAEDPNWKVALINALGERRDTGGRSPVLKALKDENREVRLAAISALGRMADGKSVSALWKIWEKGEAAEKAAATDALLNAAEELSRSPKKEKAARKIYDRLQITERL
ncbi:MAG TPA: HEAT repeat domain-containing protein [bacterium]|nr:HEAT repeat domain-containing protein [bacterium]